MLECQTCLLRCLRAIAGETNVRVRPTLRRSVPAHNYINRRRYATTSEDEERYRTARRRDVPQDPHDAAEWKRRLEEKTVMRRNLTRSSEDRRETQESRLTIETERKIKKELVYLKDPLKLADHVRQTLIKKEDLSKALTLCRVASKNMDCVVSWNHCIGWLLSRRKANEALKVYNEMKKRAQFPDGHTYAIILRGLSEPPMHQDTVGKAISIYHSLSAPNSRVKQTILHTNAALRVCAKAHDMDALWGVASKLPERGPGAADNFTFVTILNAIRENALYNDGVEGKRVDDNALAAAKAQAVEQGRRIWGDIVGKWRDGHLVVDEYMACAMGRLLLISIRPADWDDILSLIEQTMTIPRLTPKLGTSMRKAEHMPIPPRVLSGEMKRLEANSQSILSEFDTKLVPSKSTRFARPGNSTLSLVLEACLKMYSFKPAAEYWNLLTDPTTYDIRPDMENVHMYLRLLRQSRSSARVVELLQEELQRPDMSPMRKTWRIAMSACARDKLNPNATDHANSLLDMMTQYKAETDAKTCLMYLELAISTEKGNVMTDAITRLGASVTELKSNISFGDEQTGKTSKVDKNDVALLFRTIIGAIDQVLQKKLIPEDKVTVWSQRRARLSAWVTRLVNKLENRAQIPRERLVVMRKQSRQLRHFTRNNLKREKKQEHLRGEGEGWVDRKPQKLVKPRDLEDFPGEM